MANKLLRLEYDSSLGITIMFMWLIFLCINWNDANATPTTVGVYRWDAYHGGTGNVYLTVKKCLSPSEYHYKLPFFGFINSDSTIEADDTDVQEKMDQEITYAKNGGVDYWAFLRYCDSTLPAMNESYAQYLSSPKKGDIKFCWILSHGLWDGNLPYWDYEKTQTINAMKDSQWIRVLENRPLLYILWDAAGSNLSDRITEIRTLAQANGLANPYVVTIDLDPNLYGCDARTKWSTSGGNGDPWYYYKNAVIAQNNGLLASSDKVVLAAHVNWDSRPYHDNPPSWWSNPPNSWYQMPTSSEYCDLVQEVVNKSQANPAKCEANTIFVYAWNEFTEGGIMCPTKKLDGTIDTSVLKGLADVCKTGKLISNSGFTGIQSWTLYANEGAGASATFAVDSGMGQVSIVNGGSRIDNLQLYQQGLFLVPGQTYLVSFKAKASDIRTLKVSIHQHDTPWTSYWSQTVNLDTSTQTFGEYSFVYNGQQSTELRINFMCGSNNNSVWLDDVDIHESTIVSAVSLQVEDKLHLRCTPNPFNPSTKISYGLSLAQMVELAIYDMRGQRVRLLVSKEEKAGVHTVEWNGCDQQSRFVSSGIYLIKLKTGNKEMVRRAVLIK